MSAASQGGHRPMKVHDARRIKLLDATVKEIQGWVRDLQAEQTHVIRDNPPGQAGKLLFVGGAVSALQIAESAIRRAQILLTPCSELLESIDRDPEEAGE